MTTKWLGALLAVAMLTIVPAGCRSNKITTETTPHTLRVVDAITKLPLDGADVKLSAPGMTMINRTDDRGMIDVGSLAFQSRPKPEELEVTMAGYKPVSLHLTNGLPPTIQITPIQNQK